MLCYYTCYTFFIKLILINLYFLSRSTATFIMLAKSDFKIDWICEETNAMGNCSTVPKITDWLEVLAANIDTNEYTDFNYCPSVYYRIQ